MSELNLHQSLEETIIKYLKSHEDNGEFSFFGDESHLHSEFVKRQEANITVKEILKDLLLKVDETQLYKECYDEKLAEHNQYPLFHLSDIFPEFKELDDELYQKLSFKESLLISNVDVLDENNKPICLGNLCLDVQVVKGLEPKLKPKLSETDYDRIAFKTILKARTASKEENDELTNEDIIKEKLKSYEETLKNESKVEQNKFVVHLNSQLTLDGGEGGSRITSWVDKKLHTIEEKRWEYFEENGDDSQQSLYVALQKGKYFLKTTSRPGETTERKYYGLSKTKDLIGEGANFILMRYMAVKKFSGTFELSTLYINGDMCRNIYECSSNETMEVNGQDLTVSKIYRNIIEECGLEHHSCTFLTNDGRIIQQEWEGCHVIVHANPTQFSKGILAQNWRKDMQLLSKYLDCKTEARLKQKTYLKDHPEIQNLIGDYVQNILLLKPDNIVPFTVDYFLSFEPYRTGKFPYFDDSEEDFGDEGFKFF